MLPVPFMVKFLPAMYINTLACEFTECGVSLSSKWYK